MNTVHQLKRGRQQSFRCPRCYDRGHVVALTIEEDTATLWPCPECQEANPDLLTRFLDLPAWVVLSALWTAGAALIVSILYVAVSAAKAIL
jgi:hypothetical protein